ncbi:MAG: hypothetical protein ACPL6C_02490, partial [bacterium]
MKKYLLLSVIFIVCFGSSLMAETGSIRPSELSQWVFINIGATDASGNCTWTDASGACWEYTGIIPQDPFDPNDPNYPRGFNDGIIRPGSRSCPDGVTQTYGITLLSWMK